jgi:hypothetical protein
VPGAKGASDGAEDGRPPGVRRGQTVNLDLLVTIVFGVYAVLIAGIAFLFRASEQEPADSGPDPK